MSEELKNKIGEFQNTPDRRWFHEGQREFFEIAEAMLAKGFTEEETLELLRKAYDTVANEYGD